MPQCLARIHLETKVGVTNFIGLEKYSAALARQLCPNFPATAPLGPARVTSIPNVSARSRRCALANADRQLPAAVAHSARRPARVCSSIPASDNPSVCIESVATHTAARQPPAIRLAPPGARIPANAAAPLHVPRVNYQFALL